MGIFVGMKWAGPSLREFAERKVRTASGTALPNGKASTSVDDGKCHRDYTAAFQCGKGEKSGVRAHSSARRRVEAVNPAG